MNIPNLVLGRVSALVRSVPYVRGMGTGYRGLARFAVRAGATPIVVAPMVDGTFMKVDLRTRTDIDAFFRGTYDSDLVATAKQLWDQTGWFLDVGANIGYYAVAMARHSAATPGESRIAAFEPFSGNYQRLRDNLALNGLEDSCRTFNLGLSSQTGRSALILREDFQGGSGTGNAAIPVSDTLDRGFSTAEIELDCLDTLWPGQFGQGERIDFVKVDIEGHEDHFLEGASQILRRHRPTVLMEVNRPYYAARGLQLDSLFLPLLPPSCRMFHCSDGQWRATATLEVCDAVDNIYIVPEERLGRESYGALFNLSG